MVLFCGALWKNKVLMENFSHDKSMRSLFNNKDKSHDISQCC